MTAAALHQLPAPYIVPILLSNIDNPSADFRWQSISELPYFTNDAQLIAPALTRKLDDKDGNVRSEATNALRRIAPEAAAKALAERKPAEGN
jgi:HEAT repeat protein